MVSQPDSWILTPCSLSRASHGSDLGVPHSHFYRRRCVVWVVSLMHPRGGPARSRQKAGSANLPSTQEPGWWFSSEKLTWSHPTPAQSPRLSHCCLCPCGPHQRPSRWVLGLGHADEGGGPGDTAFTEAFRLHVILDLATKSLH